MIPHPTAMYARATELTADPVLRVFYRDAPWLFLLCSGCAGLVSFVRSHTGIVAYNRRNAFLHRKKNAL
jgi:hypothetical protein